MALLCNRPFSTEKYFSVDYFPQMSVKEILKIEAYFMKNTKKYST